MTPAAYYVFGVLGAAALITAIAVLRFTGIIHFFG